MQEQIYTPLAQNYPKTVNKVKCILRSLCLSDKQVCQIYDGGSDKERIASPIAEKWDDFKFDCYVNHIAPGMNLTNI